MVGQGLGLGAGVSWTEAASIHVLGQCGQRHVLVGRSAPVPFEGPTPVANGCPWRLGHSGKCWDDPQGIIRSLGIDKCRATQSQVVRHCQKPATMAFCT